MAPDLAARSALHAEPVSDSGGKRLPVILLTLAVLFGLGVLVCFLILIPR